MYHIPTVVPHSPSFRRSPSCGKISGLILFPSSFPPLPSLWSVGLVTVACDSIVSFWSNPCACFLRFAAGLRRRARTTIRTSKMITITTGGWERYQYQVRRAIKRLWEEAYGIRRKRFHREKSWKLRSKSRKVSFERAAQELYFQFQTYRVIRYWIQHLAYPSLGRDRTTRQLLDLYKFARIEGCKRRLLTESRSCLGLRVSMRLTRIQRRDKDPREYRTDKLQLWFLDPLPAVRSNNLFSISHWFAEADERDSTYLCSEIHSDFKSTSDNAISEEQKNSILQTPFPIEVDHLFRLIILSCYVLSWRRSKKTNLTEDESAKWTITMWLENYRFQRRRSAWHCEERRGIEDALIGILIFSKIA